jgi:uncharacterized repeat protein (TIGR01451 family)
MVKLFTTGISAQFVTIPQECLRNQLKIKFPPCFNASDQLDTTCAAVLSASRLSLNDCKKTIVPDLTVLRYFKSLTNLTLDYGNDDEGSGESGGGTINFTSPNTLKKVELFGNSEFDVSIAPWFIKNLPESVEELSITGTKIEFEKFPASLSVLEIFGYQYNKVNLILPGKAFHPNIKKLKGYWSDIDDDFIAPANLQELYLIDTDIQEPEFGNFLGTLPSGVKKIEISETDKGFRLPTNLPSELEYLHLSPGDFLQNNPLNLPSKLSYLYIFGKPGQMSALPPSLEFLKLVQCQITNPSTTFSVSLPKLRHFETLSMPMPVLPQFSDELIFFKVNNGSLNSLPSLPKRLVDLDVNFNQLTQLPTLPANLRTLRATSNSLVKLPPLPASLRTLDVSRNPALACLPTLPDSLQSLNFTGAQFICIPNTTVFINATPNRPLCTDSSRICTVDQPIFGGRVFLDVNKNGAFDGADKVVPNAIIQLGGTLRFATTQSDGKYLLLGNGGVSNTFRTTYSNPYLETVLPSAYTVLPSGGGLQSDTFNFAIQLQNVQDLEVFIANTFARPGFVTTAWVTVQNRGGVDVNNATLQFLKPATWILEETSPVNTSTSGDTIIWSGLNFPVGSSQSFLIRTKLPATATILGNPYTYWARILPLQNDQTPNNNVARRIDTIRGAYDPNDKLVDQATLSPAYTPDTELLYTIRFQNTGTDTAFKVVVTDTILSRLKPESIRVISASHAFKFELDEGGIAVFTFDNILLPDSNINEPASHGYVMLALKPKAGLAMNDIIENAASIFFDFNEPIITNTASTIIKVISGLSGFISQSLTVFPNPTSGNFRVVWPFDQPVVLSVMDLSGRQLFNASYNQSFADVDMSSLNKGIYIVQVSAGDQTAFAKVVVQ